MQAAARLQAAIELLAAIEESALPADRLMRDFFRARRYAGSKDRAAVAERVFTVLRRRAEFAWRMGSEAPRALTLGSLLAEGLAADAIEALCCGGYGPAPLDAAEKDALRRQPSGAAQLWVGGNFPAFLETELSRAFGAALPAAMAAMQRRAAVDLRVNTLRATREAVQAALAAEGFAVLETPFSPFGLRIAPGEGSAKLGASALFAGGGFEFQDEASQIAAILCGAKPEMRVLDLAAGTGGKSLALASIMANQGEIVAHDIAPQRLQQLDLRARKAGARSIRIAAEPPSGRFDIVLVDAPCSGSGTWRRQPELRWRLTEDLLAGRRTVQRELLERAAELVAPGGRLVYATCSLLPCENEDQIEAFRARHPAFTVESAAEVWQAETGGKVPPGMADIFRAAPHTAGTDGFFAAILRKRAAA
jgi:16S rRNA (cytosine967-C5)-methyltransferase